MGWAEVRTKFRKQNQPQQWGEDPDGIWEKSGVEIRMKFGKWVQLRKCSVPVIIRYLCLKRFTLGYQIIIDKHIPLKPLSRRQLKFNSKSLITPALKKSIQIKNKWHRKFLKTKSMYFYNKFKFYRNKLNHLLKLTRKQDYNAYFSQNINNSKNIWKGIRKILNINQINQLKNV